MFLFWKTWDLKSKFLKKYLYSCLQLFLIYIKQWR